MTFKAGEPGKVNQKIEIVTELGEHKSAELSAIGEVNLPLAGK
jgi:hypothetical protein